MNTLQSSLYAIAIVSCLLCAAVAGSKRAPTRFNYLVAYLVLEALRYAFQWLMVDPGVPAKALWLGLLMASSFLLAPTLWLFAREVADRQRPSLRSLGGPHAAVVALSLLLIMPLWLTTHGGTGFANPAEVLSAAHSRFIHGTMLAAVALFLCQVPYYLKACVRLLAAHGTLSRAMFSDVEPTTLGTLRLLIVIVGANWLVGLLRALHCLMLGAETGWGLLFCLMEVGATAAVVFLLMRRTAVFSLEERELAEAVTATGAAEPVAVKYARSALDAPTRTRIRQKLAEALTARRLHRDAQITLRGLCAALNENAHYVSQVINQDLGTTFHDLMKKARIDDAKDLLLAQPGSTVLEVALTVGFNSKSTFNAAFRQHAGMTPTDYRNLPTSAQQAG